MDNNNNSNKHFKVDQRYNPMLDTACASEQPSYRRQVENMLTEWTRQREPQVHGDAPKKHRLPRRHDGGGDHSDFDRIMDEDLARQLQQLEMNESAGGIEPVSCSKRIPPSRKATGGADRRSSRSLRRSTRTSDDTAHRMRSKVSRLPTT